MKKTIQLILVVSLGFLAQQNISAQSVPTKSTGAEFNVPSSAIKMKQIGKFTLPSVELNQLKSGFNVIRFSSSQVFGVDSAVNSMKKIVLISGTGVRTSLGKMSTAFQCSGGTCTCQGDVDCNNLFSTNACQIKGIVVSGSCIGANCFCQMR